MLPRPKNLPPTAKSPFPKLSTQLTQKIATYLTGSEMLFFSRVNQHAASFVMSEMQWKQYIENDVLYIREENLKTENETYKQACERHIQTIKNMKIDNCQFEWRWLRRLLANQSPIYKNAIIYQFITSRFVINFSRYILSPWNPEDLDRNGFSFPCPPELREDLFNAILACKPLFTTFFHCFSLKAFIEYRATLAPANQRKLLDVILKDSSLLKYLLSSGQNHFHMLFYSLAKEEKDALFALIIEHPAIFEEFHFSDCFIGYLFEVFDTAKQKQALLSSLKSDNFAKIFISNFLSFKFICEFAPDMKRDLLKRILRDKIWFVNIVNRTRTVKEEIETLSFLFLPDREGFYQAMIANWHEVMRPASLKQLLISYPEKRTEILALIAKEPEKQCISYHSQKEWLDMLIAMGFEFTPERRKAVFEHHLNSAATDKYKWRIALKLVTLFTTLDEQNQLLDKLLDENMLAGCCSTLEDCRKTLMDSFFLFDKVTDRLTQLILKHKTVIFRWDGMLECFISSVKRNGIKLGNGMSETDFVRAVKEGEVENLSGRMRSRW